MSKRKEEMSESDSPLEWRLRAIVGEENLLVDEPMSEHTTFEIGGPADFYVIPEDFDEVRDVIAACKDAGVDYFVLGCGSDLLVSDEGYRGVIVAVADGLVGVSVEGDEICCQAGVGLREASEMACELGLSGLEFACGIPGSVGGACFMNAGAYGGCMADALKEVRVLLPDGSVVDVPAGELNLGYRKSRIADEGCVGMAANMIGVRKRIIAVNMGFMNVAMFNPRIVKKSGSYRTEEGCLSLIGVRPCTRYQEIELEYQDMNWKKQRQKYTGWIAQIIQHEIDHCNGIVI